MWFLVERRLPEMYRRIVCWAKFPWLVCGLCQSGDFQEEQGGGGDEEEEKSVYFACVHTVRWTHFIVYTLMCIVMLKRHESRGVAYSHCARAGQWIDTMPKQMIAICFFVSLWFIIVLDEVNAFFNNGPNCVQTTPISSALSREPRLHGSHLEFQNCLLLKFHWVPLTIFLSSQTKNSVGLSACLSWQIRSASSWTTSFITVTKRNLSFPFFLFSLFSMINCRRA